MNRFYVFILALFTQVSIFAQCIPDASLPDDVAGLFPAPENPNTNPDGGITEPACIGQPYEFVFTLVTTVDAKGTPLGDLKVDSILLSFVDGLPEGLTYRCDTGNCSTKGGDKGCLIISGTPTANNEPGDYIITMGGTLYAKDTRDRPTTLSTDFPDEVNFPGDIYILELRDANCTSNNCALMINTSVKPATCFSADNGEATVQVTGAQGRVTYKWDAAARNQTTATATGLKQGTYKVTITDEEGCSEVKEVSVGAGLGSVDLRVTKNSDSSCETGGSATVEVTNPSPNATYTYQWSNNATTATVNNLAPGTYGVTVSSSTGACFGTNSVTIGGQGNTLEANITKQDVKCNGGTGGAAEVNVVGGNSGATFLWSNTSTNRQLTGLTAGTYTVTITKSGCSVVKTVEILQPTAITATITKTDADCSTGLGTAMVTAQGGNGGYTYRWSNNQTTASISNLQPNTYTVTITDSQSCTATQTVTIGGTSSAYSVTTASTNVACNGLSTGRASVTVIGGTGITYKWSTGANTAAVTNLAAGVYTVTITDDTNCASTRQFTITQPAAINANITKTDISCDGSTLGSAMVAPTGGNGNYTYAWSNNRTTSSITGLSPGTYTVTITDAMECRQTATVQIAGPASALTATTTVQPTCNGAATGSATVVASGGFGTYTYRWSNNQTTATATNLAAGNHQVTVSDNGGCTRTVSVTINQLPAIAVDKTVQNISCKGGTDGRATVTPTGGTAPYRYAWSVTGAGTAATATVLPEGTHTVTVTDANSCTKVETIVIGSPSQLVANISAVTNECSSGAATSLQASGTGGTAPYTYRWSNDATTSVIANLAQQNYSVTVTDSKGCTATKSINVTSVSNALSAEVETVTDVTCKGSKDGTIRISAFGGAGGYTYNWSVQGAANSATINGLSGGTYTVTVSDAGNTCPQVLTINVREPDSLKLNIEQTSVSCNGLSDGTLNASVAGGNGDFIYQWSNDANSSSVAGLQAGTYGLTVTDKNGCTDQDEVELLEPEVLVANIEPRGVTGCQNTLPTSLGVTVMGGNGGTLTYRWSTSATTSTISNIQQSTYSVTVTDRRNCTATDTLQVSESTGAFTAQVASQQNVACNGGRDGRITVQATGGTGTYRYAWSVPNVGNVAMATNLAAGTYTITVTDGTTNDCQEILTITLTQPNPIEATINKTDIKCGGETNGTATVLASGGNSGFSYRWSHGPTTATVNNLMAGQYTVTTTDGRGCTTTDTVSITAPTAITVNIETMGSATCTNSLPTAIQAMVQGGSGAYTYRWSTNATTSSIQNPVAGNYTVTVTDANNCTKTASIEVNAENNALQVGIDKTDISCNGQTDGSIQLTPASGVAPYTYDWRLSLPNAGNTATVNNLAAGNYQVIINDAGDCKDTLSITITQPDALEASNVAVGATCFGLSDGRATVSVFGGTSPYTYRWSSNVSTANTASNLRAGSYTVTATDTKGCTVTQNIVVTQPAQVATTTTALGAGCSGRTPSSIIAKVTSGKAPFTYNWSNGSTRDTLINPPMGNYTLIVTDSLKCKDTIAVTVNNDAVPLQLRVEKTDLACNSEGGGIAQVIATGGGGSIYNYRWSNNATTAQITGLSQGDYEVTVTDDTGCRDSIKVNIANLGKFEARISNTAVSCPGAADGTAIVVPSRGAPSDYKYQWSNSSASSSIARLSGGTYTVTVTETATNCVVISSTNILEADSIKIEVEQIRNLSCSGDNNGSIDISATGGQGTLNYRWSNSSLSPDLTAVGEGTYILTVTDANNCKETLEVAITEPEPLTINIAVVNETGINNGRVTANVTGGTPGYNYVWLNNAGQVVGNQQTVSNLPAGIYTVQITDRNGCDAQRSAAIQSQGCTGTFEVTLTAQPTACDGTGGQISTEVTGGNAPYSYKWSTPNSDTTANLENLAPGEYTVTVLDSGGCPKLESVVVSNPGAFVISFSSRKEIVCAGDATGGVTATPNGAGPFKYQWSTGDTIRTIENQFAGEYTVTVTNGRGCVASRTIELEQPDTLFAKITSRTNVTCSGANNGTTAVIAEGGTGPYSYRWSSNTNNATDTNLSNLAAGIYLVTATDINNCTTSTSVTITEPTPLDAGGLATSVSCAGVENGSATLFVSGGTAPYSYLWSNNRTDSTEINLPAGAYTITVTDAQNCKDTVSVTVESPQELTINVTSSNEQTPNANDGTAQAIPSGGTPPYQYRWDNNTTQQLATGLAPGTRTVTVTDSKGCSKVGSVRINEASCIISVQVTGTNIDCNGATTGRASAQVSNGGDETLSYVWSNTQTGATISGLRAGTYTVTVEQANTSCTANASVTITEPSPITSSITNKADIGCSGGMGSATVTASGGTGTLSYLWSTGASTATANNLTAGINSVTITDRNGCQKVETVTINQASGISLQVGTVNNVACAGANTGTATINVTGGNGSYTYKWSNNVNSTTATANELAAGTYTVTVSDGDGCESTTQVTITQPTPLAANTSVNSNVTCRGESNGNATVNVTGGTAGYSYRWSTNATTAQVNNLPAGQHTVTITDANNCTTTSAVTITQPEALQVTINSSNESAAGSKDGQARADAIGGTPPYRYSWSIPNTTTRTVSNLSPGNYTVTITDANGCTVTASTVIQQGGINCAPFNILIADFPTTCATTADGRAEVTNVTGSSPYQYRWSNGDTTPVADSLAAGSYTVTVTGSDGCPSQQTVTITKPTALDFSVKTENEDCEQSKNGAAIIEATGGTIPYSFMWQDGIGGNLRDTLVSGNYTVTITDANQCQALATFTITVDEDRTPPVAVAKNITVYIDAFGQAEINVNDVENGSTDNCDLASVSLSKQIFTCDDLGANNIQLIANDRSGNRDSVTVIVTVADTIKPFLDCQQDDILITNCEADRTITFSMPQAFDNCGAPLTPTLMEGLPSGSVFPPGVTEQVFMVEDPAGNQAVCSFEVNIQVLSVAVEQDEPSCFNFADGSLTANVLNSSGQVFYSWNNGRQTQSITGLTAGNYSVTVIDGQGCTRVESIQLTQPELLTVKIDSFINPKQDLDNGAIYATVAGGIPPYNHQWLKFEGNTSEILQNVEDLINLGAGDYRLTIIDDNGCSVVSEEIVLRIVSAKNTIHERDVILRPNPTSGNLSLEMPAAIVRIYDAALYDMTGRLVKTIATQQFNNGALQMDLSDYDGGVYFLRIQVADQILTKRVVLIKE